MTITRLACIMGRTADLAHYFLEAVDQAVIASAAWRGKGEKNAADAAAVEAMRQTFDTVPFDGRVAIGEGERDEAPMLFIGEELGCEIRNPDAPMIDIAVDPLECTNNCANNTPNSIAVLAAAPRGALLHAPDCYMDKLAAGPSLAGHISLEGDIAYNIEQTAYVLDKDISDVRIVALDRERHTDLFKQIKAAINFNNLIHIKVEGSQWRMGTSSLHFMDLFLYFTGCDDFKFTETQLSNELIDSRHKGCQEFKGRMMGENSRGDTLSLICLGPEDNPPTIEIVNGTESYKITGLDGEVGFESTNDLSDLIGQATLPYQSQLTNIWVDDILSRGSCALPTYAESMPLHLELIRVLTNHLEKITGKEIDACPIT